MPREVFVLDLIQAIGRCTSAHAAAQHLLSSCDDPDDREHESSTGNDDGHACSPTRFRRFRAATQHGEGQDEHQLGAQARASARERRASGKLHGVAAVSHARPSLPQRACFVPLRGWSARNHLDFDLDALCEPTSDSETRWENSACGSSSSVADSGLDDSASEHVGESSMSSISQDSSRPPSAADKPFGVGSSPNEWLPTCSSPLAATGDAQSLDVSRTGSSLGSSTVYGHVDSSVEASEPRRRSREPKAGSLLSRNLIRARTRHASLAASDSSSVRSLPVSIKRAPRCAGVQVDFTDPAANAPSAPAPVRRRRRSNVGAGSSAMLCSKAFARSFLVAVVLSRAQISLSCTSMRDGERTLQCSLGGMGASRRHQAANLDDGCKDDLTFQHVFPWTRGRD